MPPERWRVFAHSLLVALAFSSVRARAQDSTVARAPAMATVRPVTVDYYGTKVLDNYRYFEDLKDPEVQRWMKSQSDYTHAILRRIPGRNALLARFRELDDSQQLTIDAVWRLPGERYFYLKRLASEATAKLYSRIGLDGEEKLLLDPDSVVLALPNQGKGPGAIESVALSDNGKYAVVGITPGGLEYDTELHVIESESGHEIGNPILRVLGIDKTQWLPDNRSFLYSQLQLRPRGASAVQSEQKQRVYMHVVGTDARNDRAVFGFQVLPSVDVDSTQFAWIETAPASQFAVGFVHDGLLPNSAIYIAPMAGVGKSGQEWRRVAAKSDLVTQVAQHGDDLYLLTFKNASNYKVVRTNARKPDFANAEVVVPSSAAVVEEMSAASDALYVKVMEGGIERLLRVSFGAHSKVDVVPLSLWGNIFLSSDPRVAGPMLFLGALTKAAVLYSYDPETRKLTNTRLQPQGPNDSPSSIESVELRIPSYDGVRVPLSIVYPKGMKRDGSHSALLSGYGAYGLSKWASFDASQMAIYERGVVQATCHVRGGGEFGEAWHLAGKESTKSNTWLDFIACAQYLIREGYTSPAHLAAEGSSAGGIMVGRAIEERPDLFAVAIGKSPASDMLRQATTANGKSNMSEFGSVDSERGFRALYSMSPYANVREGTKYPAVLVSTGTNDPRVAPWEPAKLVARLQAATTSRKPVLLFVDSEAGHFYTLSEPDEWTFILWQTGDPDFQPINP